MKVRKKKKSGGRKKKQRVPCGNSKSLMQTGRRRPLLRSEFMAPDRISCVAWAPVRKGIGVGALV